jgi:hypothetical protein
VLSISCCCCLFPCARSRGVCSLLSHSLPRNNNPHPTAPSPIGRVFILPMTLSATSSLATKSMSFAASNAKRVATLLIGLPTSASPFKAIAPTTVAAFKKFPSAPLSQPHRPWGCFGLSWDATPYRVCIGCWRVRCSPLCAIAAVIAISPSAAPLEFHSNSQAAAHRMLHIAAISRKLTNSPSCDSISGAGYNPDKPLCDPVPTQRDRGT